MTDSKLVCDFLQAINDVSYHNAAEGRQYWEEIQARNAAERRLRELKLQMVEQYGKEKTLEIANSRPHLLFSELYDLAE